MGDFRWCGTVHWVYFSDLTLTAGRVTRTASGLEKPVPLIPKEFISDKLEEENQWSS